MTDSETHRLASDSHQYGDQNSEHLFSPPLRLKNLSYLRGVQVMYAWLVCIGWALNV